MRAIIVLAVQLVQQLFQICGRLPCLVREPFLERAHKSFDDPVGLGTMAGNQYMDEVRLARKLREDLGGEMRATVRNQRP